jgi:hypothetical protein
VAALAAVAEEARYCHCGCSEELAPGSRGFWKNQGHYNSRAARDVRRKMILGELEAPPGLLSPSDREAQVRMTEQMRVSCIWCASWEAIGRAGDVLKMQAEHRAQCPAFPKRAPIGDGDLP